MKNIHWKNPIVWVFLLGLVLRLGSLAVNYEKMYWENDWRMSVPAVRMLEGKGLSLTDETGPSAYRPPLYILWLAGAYAIFGPFSEFGPSLLQILVSSLNVLLVYLLAKEIWKQKDYAVASALLLAIHPYVVYHDAALYHTFLSTALLLAGSFYLVRGINAEKPKPLFASGIFFGLCILILSTIVPWLALVILAGLVLWKIPFKKRATLTAVFAAGIFLAWSPWIIRNAIVFNEFVPLTTEAGVTLWMGNNPNSAELLKTRGHEASPVPKGTAFNLPSAYLGCVPEGWCRGGITEVEENTNLRDMAMGWITTHPWDFTRLTVWRFAGIWSPFLTPAKDIFASPILNTLVTYEYMFWNLLLAALFVVGMRIGWKERRRVPLILLPLLALTATGGYALFLYYTKYRIPFETVLLAICGAGLAELFRRMKKMRILAPLFLIALVLIPSAASAQETEAPNKYYKGTVESIQPAREFEAVLPGEGTFQDVRVRIEDKTSGWTVDAEYNDNSSTDADDLRVGDRVTVIRTEVFPGETRYIVTEKYRLPSLLVLLGIFFASAVAFAGRRGVTAILGLGFSMMLLVFYTIPSIVEGQEPFFVAAVSVFVIAIVSLTVAHGFSKQTGIALVSTLATLILSLGLSEIFVRVSKLAGAGTEEAFALQLSGYGNIDIRGLLLAGIVIGVLGVLDDVTTTQTAAIKGFSENGVRGFKNLYRAGSAVGREHIVSLVNTLALAYAGAALPLLLAFSVNEGRVPFWVILNGQMIAEEVVRTLIGSTALIFAVPISTFIAAKYYSQNSPPSTT